MRRHMETLALLLALIVLTLPVALALLFHPAWGTDRLLALGSDLLMEFEARVTGG